MKPHGGTWEPPLHLIRADELAKRLGVSTTTLWRWANGNGHPTFPQPIRLSPRVKVWRVADVEAWLSEQAESQILHDQRDAGPELAPGSPSGSSSPPDEQGRGNR
ncbi:MAG: AlpA family phage regulatory protein [Acidimicrobiia bacterium]|nr:AlpA family phage regulatory protein [Acidimicrobiia bacterium]MYG72754.1 AlpA family phage regulatory protein [Acidimicrobiia bacterium]